MPFPTVIVRTFDHSVVHWCTLSDAKIYGYWSMSCLTLFCMSILAPLERSSCTTSAWPLLPASMRAVCPFWGDKIYCNIVLQTSILIRHCSYHYFHHSFVCGYYLKVEFTFMEAHRHQQWLDKVGMNEMVTITRHCQWYAQPLSSAVSCGNNLYNIGNTSASMVIVIRKYSHMCTPAYNSHG